MRYIFHIYYFISSPLLDLILSSPSTQTVLSSDYLAMTLFAFKASAVPSVLSTSASLFTWTLFSLPPLSLVSKSQPKLTSYH